MVTSFARLRQYAVAWMKRESMTIDPNDRHWPPVFISFASCDRDPAERLAEALDASGIPSFFAPRDIHGGMNFAVEIVKAVAACDLVVVLLSPGSIASPHVRREVSLAIDERRELLPLAMPGTKYPIGFSREWTYWLSAVQVTDYISAEAVVGRVRRFILSNRTGADATGLAFREGTTPSRRSPSKRKVTGTNTSPSALLRPDRRIIALEGRDLELARLEQWCRRGGDFDARLLTGAAGQGKTRLAHELMRMLAEQGWSTRLVEQKASGTNEILGLKDRKTLLVIDYAETRGQQLTEMCEALLHHGVDEKVRMLLIARTASDWWKAVLTRTEEASELLGDATIQPLPAFIDDRDRTDRLYVAACQRFATELSIPAPLVVTAPLRAFGSVLEILEAALARVLGDATESGTGTNRLLAHERRYIAASAIADGIPDVEPVDFNRIAAALTLVGTDSEDAATAVIMECNRDLLPPIRRRIARLFRRLYPGASFYIDGIRPDALAEELIADVLTDDGRLPIDAVGTAGAHRSVEQKRRALTLLSRAAVRHPTVAHVLDALIRSGDEDTVVIAMMVATQVEQPDLVAESIANAVAERIDLDAASLLAIIPDETVAMAKLAAQLSRSVIAGLPDVDAMSSADIQLTMDCSNRFSDAGWTTEAAGAAQLAVDRLSDMVSTEDSRRQLGRALTNLSNRLWETGHTRESLHPARQAVDSLLLTKATVGELAAARNNLSFRLGELGRAGEAADEALEAERLCRTPGPTDDPNVTKTLGSSLNNLSCFLLSAGDTARAYDYATRCVDLRRSQAIQNRDRYLPFVARALANAAPAAEANGEPEQADRLIVEARSLHEITGVRAPIFRFEEAESATIQARILLARGGWEHAGVVAEEAGKLLRSIEADLGELADRLNGNLLAIKALIEARMAVGIGDPRAALPQLLEYRDL